MIKQFAGLGRRGVLLKTRATRQYDNSGNRPIDGVLPQSATVLIPSLRASSLNSRSFVANVSLDARANARYDAS